MRHTVGVAAAAVPPVTVVTVVMASVARAVKNTIDRTPVPDVIDADVHRSNLGANSPAAELSPASATAFDAAGPLNPGVLSGIVVPIC
jgi:hypothetical protein